MLRVKSIIIIVVVVNLGVARAQIQITWVLRPRLTQGSWVRRPDT
jgi:hypothetical protein